MSKRFLVLSILICCSFETRAESWPKLIGERHEHCVEALRIAEASFKSDAFSLLGPPTVPVGLESTLVLKPKRLEHYGDSLEADASVLDKLPLDESENKFESQNHFYWQKVPAAGRRLVLIEQVHSWRGNWYALFMPEETMSPPEFLVAFRDEKTPLERIVSNQPSFLGTSAISSYGWQPPLLLRVKNSSQLWVIEIERLSFLAPWRVHVATSSGMHSPCSIVFRPDVRRATNLLPKAVREYARLLEDTMGRGENEGTLQSTARLRGNAEDTWAVVALRPWIVGDPYNTREEVDAGLERWAATGPSYRKHYERIQKQYPLAERALANYYRGNFGRSAEEAKQSAAYMLDLALRSHYAFHSGDPNSYFRDTGTPNPWKKR